MGEDVGSRTSIRISTKVSFTPPRTSKYEIQLRSKNSDEEGLASDSSALGIDGIEEQQGQAFIDHEVPTCAKDVLFSLHREVGGADEDSCSGLLIRDDIIVTSHECSKFNFTFHLEKHAVQAVPHPSLNSKKEMEGSRLGFLKAYTPNHYHFVDQPVHKTRVFLSHRPSPDGVDGTEKGAKPVIMSCAGGYVPIAHHFPVDGEMVLIGQLAEAVPEDVLWDYLDLQTATMQSYKKHRWWTRSVTLEDEERYLKSIFPGYQGPPGSISIPDAHSDFVDKIFGMLEVLDPLGHRQKCFPNYYVRYRTQKPFSRMHFFDWLDFGPGKFIIEQNFLSNLGKRMYQDNKCEKINFNSKPVYYFSEEEKNTHEIYIEPSDDETQLIARYKNNDNIVPESYEDDPHLYMWDLDGKFYIVDNTWDKYHRGPVKHSGLMNGGPALSGGKAYFGKGGAIWGINFSSGHYRPDIQAASMMYQLFKNQKFNLTAIHWVGRMSWTTESCVEFDWDSIEIPEYEAAELKQSCHEMTTNPMWVLKDDV